MGGFGGSREAGRDALRDRGQVSVGWAGQWGHPPGPGLAGWGMSSDSQAAHSLSAEPWGLQPSPCGPALLGLHPTRRSSPISSLFHSCDLCPSSWHGSPFLSAAPYLSLAQLSADPELLTTWIRWAGVRGPWGKPLQLLDAPRALHPAGWALPQWAPSAQAAQQRQRKLTEDPALLRRMCQVQLTLSV